MTAAIAPGLLALHGNRAELLAEAVFEWLGRQPLGPLEEEIFLVQSNGVAEWLKMALAERSGICAATRVELPGRFLWRAYRQLLGAGAVPERSALDKLPLTWRLMHLLPAIAPRPGFEPLAGFLGGGAMDRRLQLAQRLADLYDQYQVYRGDWLAAWAAGQDRLPRSEAEAAAAAGPPLPAGERWQAALWRELLAPLGAPERAATRPQLHGRFLAALGAGVVPARPLPRRVVLFGMTHVPMPILQALAALSARSQVLLAIPNPCRYHWADILQGRELLRIQHRRQPLPRGRDLAAVPLEQMHDHAHPLLAAWGRQGRDFVRQLDAFDDAQAARQRFPLARIDLFDDGPGTTLLQQVQARIRDLVPLAEHPAQEADPADRSIVFHVAHSAQREVEILHDQLLELLARPPEGRALSPREVVVMVPDIAVYAPAIRAVFGAVGRGDARHVPYDIADLQERGNNPLLVALEWLLRLPQQRCTASEVRDLLDVPAVAARFGLAGAELPRLALWLEGAGIRWGLDATHRAGLDLAACGEQNSWRFGLQRMLLGYASGAGTDGQGAAWREIEPYAEIGGLEAALVGSLAAVVDALQRWAVLVSTAATPAQWAGRARELIAAFMAPTDARERLTVAALQEALRGWLQACETAGFEEPVTLAVAREAWLAGIDEPALGRRFRAGGVTFCTLLPLRAIPFEVVCLLGMNEGDYPRRSPRSDFDLMGLPGQARPGDRSRRDDDRQLMLEAVLSARRVLYVSWAGRNVRDNSEQPPSVLVSQLRDYLAAGWRGDVLGPRTTEHPLQPFSRRYFELQPAAPRAGERLFTHAREWRAAHVPAAAAGAAAPPPAFEPDPGTPLTVAALARFLKDPVREHFRLRLGVVFRDADEAAPDDEAFDLAGLEEHAVLAGALDRLRAVLQGQPERPGDAAALRRQVEDCVASLRRAGGLPMAALGRRSGQELVEALLPMLRRWEALQRQYPQACERVPLRQEHAGLLLDDALAGLRATAAEPDRQVWLELVPGRLCRGDRRPAVRPERLLGAWVRTVAAAACGLPVRGVLVGRDATVSVEPMPVAEAAAALAGLMRAWREGMTGPLPLACRTALARAADAADVAAVYDGGPYLHGEVEEPCLARLYPDYEALTADGRFPALAERLYGPIVRWTRDRVSLQLHPAPTPGAPAAEGSDGG
jgi:exodeoxyribonuclease V gamma subunit